MLAVFFLAHFDFVNIRKQVPYSAPPKKTKQSYSRFVFLENIGVEKQGSNAFITGPGRYRKLEEK